MLVVGIQHVVIQQFYTLFSAHHFKCTLNPFTHLPSRTAVSILYVLTHLIFITNL